MKRQNPLPVAIVLALTLFSPLTRLHAQDRPHARVIALSGQGKEQSLLSGPPETVSMRSGLITLQPHQSVGKHSTRQNEEMLVVLEGQGKMLFSDDASIAIAKNHVLYCPPQTEHDVINTGTGVLRYVYIVASANLK